MKILASDLDGTLVVDNKISKNLSYCNGYQCNYQVKFISYYGSDVTASHSRHALALFSTQRTHRRPKNGRQAPAFRKVSHGFCAVVALLCYRLLTLVNYLLSQTSCFDLILTILSRFMRDFVQFVEFFALEVCVATGVNGVTDLSHQVVVEVQIVQDAESHAEHLFCFQKMMDVGS